MSWKTMFIALVAAMLIGGCTGAIAQEIPVEKPSDVVFTGFRYDDGPLMSFGYGHNLMGDLWNFDYTDFGAYQSLNVELAYLFDLSFVKEGLAAGILAGPNADWYGGANTVDSIPTVTYFVGAAGILSTYEIKDKFGAWGYGKYKFSLESDNFYPDGYIWGLGLYYNIGE